MHQPEIERAARLLGEALRGARLDDVRQPAPGVLWLGFYAPGQGASGLRIDVRPHLAHVVRTGKRPPPNAPQPPPVVLAMRRALEGGRVSGVEALEGERALVVDVQRADGTRWRVLVELSGHHPNAFLLDEAGVIRAQVAPNRSKLRALWPGQPWEPPRSRPPAPGDDRFATVPDEDFFGAVGRYFAQREAAGATRELRARLAAALRRRLRKAARRTAAIEGDLARAAEADQLARYARLITYNLPNLRTQGHGGSGRTHVSVVDYENPALPVVVVPVDPSLPLQRVAERYFARARRLQRARAGIEARLAEASRHEESLRQALAEVEGAPDDLDALTELAARHAPEVLRVRGDAPAERRKRDSRRAPAERPPFRRYVGSGGAEILVGRSAADNDRLTLQVARGDDVWMHAMGRRGAHVVLRCERGREPTPEALLDAALLAAWHSEGGRHENSVEVMWTRRRYVRKGRRQPPGEVTVSKVRNIRVPVDAARVRAMAAAAREREASSEPSRSSNPRPHDTGPTVGVRHGGGPRNDVSRR